jgi:membrane protease YdiL (CAAX protease family)
MGGFGLSVGQMMNAMQRPTTTPEGWKVLMMVQGVTLGLVFGGGALALASAMGYRWAEYFSPRRLGAGWWLLAAAGLIVVILPLMSVLIAWNAGAHFPGALHDFEVWARASEDRAAVLTKFLTKFNSGARFAVGVLVIALVPAVAEELVFRGVIQKNLVRWFSPHVGVWLGAAIFSAIHMQFFGFVPRFVLGLVLGYLYLWSGNILVSMAAHFTQNALQLLILYLTQRGQFGWGFDPDSNDALPLTLVIPSVLLTGGLLYVLHRSMTAPAAPTQMLTIGSDGVRQRV